MPGIDESLNKLFITTEETREPEKAEVAGTLPEWIAGTYLRVGPGKFDFPGDFTLNHWLDGYAILSKFEISKHSIVFEKRFLQSDAYTRSLAASRPVINEFGTKAHTDPNKGFFSRMISSIIPEFTDNDYSTLFKIGKDVFAICDTCFFRRVDPKGLDTREKCDGNKYFGMNGLCAHPLVDDNGDTWCMGFTVLTGIKYNVIKIPKHASSKEMLKKSKVVASLSSRWNGCIAAAHSFGMSENYVVFVEQPHIVVASKMASSIIKGDTVKDWMEWRPQDKNRICIFSKKSGKFLKTEFISNEAFHFLHFINCYEEDDQLIVDIIVYDSPSVLDTLYLSKLRDDIQEKVDLPHAVRFVIPVGVDIKNVIEEEINLVTFPNTKATAIKQGNQIIVSPDVLTQHGLELPAINPKFMYRKYSFMYAAGTFNTSLFSNSLCKIDMNTKEVILWKENDNYYPGEPMFVPKPNAAGEDDGLIISAVTDKRMGHQDFLLFLDAKNMTEIGRAKFKSHIPSSLHGIFLP